jgi:hypothetical protein
MGNKDKRKEKKKPKQSKDAAKTEIKSILAGKPGGLRPQK